MKLVIVLVGCLLTVSGFAARAVDPFKELTIVEPAVMTDARVMPGGPWHFGTLVREMMPAEATAKEISDFVVNWLLEWEVDSFNGFPMDKRPFIRDEVVCPWANASAGTTDCTGTLNMDLAPFRLLAIANRIDLRKAGVHAGEGRFVFAVLSAPTSNPLDPNLFANSFTILVDYNLPLTETKDLKFWTDAWHNLGALNCVAGDCAEYLAAFEKVTDAFTRRGSAPGRVNDNPLSDIRSNEIALASPWQLREFKYVQTEKGPALTTHTVNKTPDFSFNNTPQLIQWVTDNEQAIMANTHAVPKDMMGGRSNMDGQKWKLDGIAEPLRLNFAKNTCAGCHNSESQASPPIGGFYHVHPSVPGKAKLSRFITEQDLPRREADFKTLVDSLRARRVTRR